MSSAAVSRLFDPTLCLDPTCNEPPMRDGLYCEPCLEAIAQDVAREVRYCPQYVPPLNWFREHYGLEEITPAQGAWLHDRTLAICRGRAIACRAFSPVEEKIWGSRRERSLALWKVGGWGFLAGMLAGALALATFIVERAR